MMHDRERGLQENNCRIATWPSTSRVGMIYFFSIGSGFFAPPGIGVRSTLTVIATST